MQLSRRKFMGGTVRNAIGASMLASWAVGAAAETNKKSFNLFPIGEVEKKGQEVRLRIYDDFVDGLLGLDGWSHVNVLCWFDKNDTPQQRRILRVHPHADKQNPLTGVFASRAPVRPNLISLTVCRILSVRANLVTLDELDVFDGTPVLDLKPFIPPDAPTQNVRVPAWAKGKKASGS